MPEIYYKFRSSLSFETLKINDKIKAKEVKDLIAKQQSSKSSCIYLELKDIDGKVFEDDELINFKTKIIVCRVPKPKKNSNIEIPNKNKISDKESDSKPYDLNKELVSKTTASVTPSKPIQINNEDANTQIIPDKINLSPNTSLNSVINNHKDEKSIIVPDYLKCNICNKLMTDAIQIFCCGKDFCYACITGHLFDPDIAGSLECPICHSVISQMENNLIENYVIRKYVNDFKNGIEVPDVIYMQSQENPIEEVTQVIETSIPEPTYEDDQALLNSNISDDIFSRVEQIVNCDEVENDAGDQVDLDSNRLINQVQPDTNFCNDLPSEFTDQDIATPVVEEVVISSNDNISVNDIQMQNVDIHPLQNVYPIVSRVECSSSNSMKTQLKSPEFQKQSKSYSNIITCMEPTPVVNDKPSNIPVNVSNQNSQKFEQSRYQDKLCNIQNMEFDPVLYMKFLTIVGERYPDELKKILSVHEKKSSDKNSRSQSRGSAAVKEKEKFEDKHSINKHYIEDSSSTSAGRYNSHRHYGKREKYVEDSDMGKSKSRREIRERRHRHKASPDLRYLNGNSYGRKQQQHQHQQQQQSRSRSRERRIYNNGSNHNCYNSGSLGYHSGGGMNRNVLKYNSSENRRDYSTSATRDSRSKYR